TVEVRTGTLAFNGGGSSSGAFQLSTGTVLQFGGSSHTVSSAASFTVPAGATVRFSGGSTTINTGNYNLAGLTQVNGGGVYFNADTSTASLTVSSGELGGSAVVTAASTTWSGGTLTGTGRLEVTDNLIMNGTDRTMRGGRVVKSNTAATWSGGTINAAEGAVFNNAGTFTATNNNTFFKNGIFGNDPQFNNTGTFIKDVGTGVTLFSNNTGYGTPQFNNSGIVEVRTGTLALDGVGTHAAGQFSLLSGAVLRLGGGQTFTGTSAISGAGTTQITGTTAVGTGAVLNVSSPLTITGTVTGAGLVNASGGTSWTAGTLTGGGTVSVTGVLTLSGGDRVLAGGKVLNNADTATWSAGQINSGEGAVFNNNGTLTNTFNGTYIKNGMFGVDPRFNNTGTFIKDGGTGATTFSHDIGYGPTIFNNTGTVEVRTGTLAFNGSFSQTQGKLVLNGGQLSRNGTFSVTGGKIQGQGTLTGGVSASGGSVSIEPGIGSTSGLLAITGDLTLTGGSKLALDVGGLTPGSEHDQLTEGGSTALSLAGCTLELGLLGAYYPTVTDTFVVVDSHATITGVFGNVPNGGRINTTDGKGSFKVNYGSASSFSDKTQVILSEFFRFTPTELSLSSMQVSENLAAGANVGTFTVTDETPGATHTFALVSGTGDTDNGHFQITGSQLLTTSQFDFETKNAYSIRVRVTSSSGELLEQTFVIQVTDVANPASLALSGNTVAENLPSGTVVGTLSATDQTPGGQLTYSLVSGSGSTNNARFSINGDALQTSQVLDFETMSAPQSVRVRVTDETGEFSEAVFAVNVINQGPTSLSLSAATVAEGLPVGTPVGTLSAEITPVGTAVAFFSKVSGAGSTDNNSFSVDGTTLRTLAVLDHEAAATRSIRLRVTDANGEVLEQVFVITVTNENDKPVISNIADVTVQLGAEPPVTNFTVRDDDSPAGDLVVTATSSNQAVVPDAGLLLGGTDGNRSLTITPVTGAAGNSTITVTVSDGTLSASDTFVFAINDQPVIGNLRFNGTALTPTLAISSSGQVTVDATDNQGVTRVEFFYALSGNAKTRFAVDSNAGDGFGAKMSVSQLPDGTYEVSATAFDAAGGSATTAGGVILTLVAPSAPVVSAPANGLRTELSSVNVVGTADPEARVRIVRGTEVLAGPTPPSANGSFSFPVSLMEGANELTVIASNRAGDSPEVSRSVEYIREFPQLSVTIQPATVTEGSVQTGAVSISPVQTSDVTVTLTSNRPSRVSVPASVVIPANESQVNFSINGIQNDVLEPIVQARVSAGGAFLKAGFKDIQVLDDDWPVLALQLEGTFVRENDGAQATFLRVSRDVARGFAQTVFLSSSLPSAAVLPPSVIIPANETTIRIPVTAVDDTVEDGAQNTVLRAWVIESATQTIVSESPPVTLEVQDDEGPTLQLLVSPTVLHEGGSFTGGGEVRLPALRAQDTTVTLAASPEGLLTLPESVLIPAGQISAVFNLTVPSTAENEGPRPVRLTCSTAGVTSGVKGVIITDVPMADLVPTLTQVPESGQSSASVAVVFRVENQGTVAVNKSQVYRMWLSRDRALGDDSLAARVFTTETLAAGGNIERTETIRLPQAEGDFYVIVEADGDSNVEEASEANNIYTSLEPITVSAGYSVVANVDGSFFPAGQAITITGQATRTDSQPADRVPVKIRVTVNGAHRELLATTTANGSFSTTFTPLAGECGNYTIAAAHPAASFGESQDSFSIVAIKPVSVPEVSFDDGDSSTATILLTNPAGLPLHNLVASLETLLPGVTVNLSLPPGAVLDGSARVPLTIEVIGDPGVSGVRNLVINITTAEGITLRINVRVTIHPLRPQLTFTPNRISQSVLRGSQKTATIDLDNTGRAESGDLQVLLPDLAMLSLATPQLIPSIPPGGKAQINLLITPPANAPLTVTNGQILLHSAESGTMSIPFDIRVTSDSRGDLTVEVTDEFTYFSAEQPMVEGARVRLRDSITGQEVAPPQVTTATGTVVFTQLNEGYYELEITEPKHASYISDVLVQPGPDNKQTIFITREMVSYQWTVKEAEVQDRYEITVKTTFETNVPAPVVTATPGQVDLKRLVAVGDEMQVNFVIENHGLIAAEHAVLRFANHPWYVIEPLVPEIGRIPAKTALTIPTIIRRVGPVPAGLAALSRSLATGRPEDQAAASSENEQVPCTLSGEVAYDYECANLNVPKNIPIAFSNVDGNCTGGLGTDFGTLFFPKSEPLPGRASSTAPGRPGFSPVSFSLPTPCDCTPTEFQKDGELDLGPLTAAIKKGLGKALPPPLTLGNVEVKLEGDVKVTVCCPLSAGLEGTGKISITVEIIIGSSLPEIDPEFEMPDWAEVEFEASGFAGAKITLTGSGEAKLIKPCGGEVQICGTLAVGGGLSLGGEFDAAVTLTEKNTGLEFEGNVRAAALLNGSVSASAQYCTGQPVKAYASASIGYELTLRGEVAHGEDKRQIGFSFPKTITAGDTPPEEAEAASNLLASGKSRPLLGTSNNLAGDEELVVVPLVPAHYPGVGTEPMPVRPIAETDAELIALARLPTGQSGVCAQVKMQLKQDLVLTRQGFEAELQLTNNQPDETLTDVGFTVDIRDSNGQPASDRFQLRAPDVAGFTNITGTGTLGPLATGVSRWILVPNDDAAPTVETTYFVGGQISYSEHGRLLTVPVVGVPIKVRPNAALKVSYFHQRDVFGDDPHTDFIEPAEPFYLGVMVHNDGFGEARNVKLTSGQPVIVDNEKGLLVAFQQETASVNGAAVAPGSTLDFGTIAAHSRSVGLFGMRGSLLGLFNDYDATFEHLDGNGDPRLSLLKSVEIHEMNHLVRAARSGDDSLPDFLTNDIADHADLPDTLHHSTGAVEAVELVASSSTGATPTPSSPSTTLNVVIPANKWGYLRIADPSAGTMRLVGVSRSDGVNLEVGTNVWITHRTMPGLAQQAIAEDILHLLDFGGSGHYVLTYAPLAADTIPPSSQVAALPANSASLIPVTWSGSDNQVLAGFDIFVSDNGGPFTLWRERTTLRGASYLGTQGHSYAFFSVAVDEAGNREPVPSNPDATTAVTITNAAPVITGLDQIHVLEGDVLSVQIAAQDTNGPLLYELVSGAPAGMTISQSGEISWATGESHGGRSYPVEVRVTDRGLPPTSSVEAFEIIVDENNTAPVPNVVPDIFLTAGDTRVIGLTATDTDLPQQELTWELANGPIPGLTLDPATGLMSLVTLPSPTARTVTAIASVRDNFDPPATATVSVTFFVAAGGGSTVTTSPVNGAPTLALIPNPAPIPLNSAARTIQLEGISAGPPGEVQAISVTAVSSNPDLIPNPTVQYTSPGSTGSITYTPIEGVHGTAEITVIVTDDGGTANGGINTVQRTFTVVVEDTVPFLSFSKAIYKVNQGATSVDVTITRTGNLSATSVTLNTADGTTSTVPPFAAAVAGTDYQTVSDIVAFAQGELSKTITVTLIPKTGTTVPNKRFIVMLSAPEGGTMIDGSPSAEVQILANDTTKPTLTVTAPGSTTTQINTISPYLVTGRTGDARGVDRVEVSLNGDAPVSAVLGAATLPTSVPWSLAIAPIEGLNILTVTAFDLRGNSTSVTRQFTFTRRYTVTVTRLVPAEALSPDDAGTVVLNSTPGTFSVLTPARQAVQSATVTPGSPVTLTARPTAGHLFSHWEGLPVPATIAATKATFSMPAQNVSDIKAVFVKNTLTTFGTTISFRGLMTPEDGTPPSNQSYGSIFSTIVSSSGAISGKLLVGGVSVSFTGVVLADGSVWLKNTLGELERSFVIPDGRNIELAFTGSALDFTVSDASTASSGTALPALYKATAPVSATASDLLNQASTSGGPIDQGLYTIALPAQVQPSRPVSEYPQGTGYGRILLKDDGTYTASGVLADGTSFTGSSFLVAGNHTPLHAQLFRPGSTTRDQGASLLGNIVFDTTQADTDVSANDMVWIRPEVPEVIGTTASAIDTQVYTAGWPDGITVGLVGAKYNKALPPQVNLDFGPGSLLFSDGKLTTDIVFTNFSIIGSVAAKSPTTDRRYSLTVTKSTGVMTGSFTPNWTSPNTRLPAFSGVIITKGANKGGWGYFISNRTGDLDPESGAVTLGAR
ncbi:MAG: hypothetical protein JNJ83_13495, partial [Verrucomicrobiaceae bacterium]|nr:hypothetical protein [Verrucomicrobiaceae bacterium]